MKKLNVGILFLSIITLPTIGFSQDYNYNQALGQELNAITTAVPFLMIAPDSRSGAMGDAGVALSPDGYSEHWNSSKLAFIDNPLGGTISYTPWLKKLVNDINLAYLAGYVQLDKNQTVGAGLRYFSMGSIQFTDGDGNPLNTFSPHEFAFDASYNRKLSDHFGLGLVGRVIYSNLTGGQGVDGSQAGKSVAMDINGFYTNKMELAGYNGNWNLGFNISNIGAKMSYTQTEKNFIPTNLRIGGSMTLNIDDYNAITATLDINKLLVPTPPTYYPKDSVKRDGTISDGTKDPSNIEFGRDNNVGIIQGMIQSFYDAPGGIKEELHEISYAGGFEYWYAKQFAVRTGYFYEHATKGNRKYVTAGVGLKMNVFGLDFSYLIPVGNFNNSPLSNTWRFSLVWDLNSFNNQ